PRRFAARAEEPDQDASALILFRLPRSIQCLAEIPRPLARPNQLRIPRIVRRTGKHLLAFRCHPTSCRCADRVEPRWLEDRRKHRRRSIRAAANVTRPLPRFDPGITAKRPTL